MEGEYNLIVSPRAEQRVDALLDFLLNEWGFRVQQNFLDDFQHCISIIRRNPYSFPVTLQDKSIRQCVVTPQNKLYYTVQNRDIIILSLEDARMNPNKVWNQLQAD